MVYGKTSQRKEKETDKLVSLVPLKLRGEHKHFPPANKEWKNSVYLYNKSNLKSLAVKDNLALKLVKSYFNLHTEKAIARSKRMRSLIRKSTTKKLFVSRPEIKQTNDKVLLTLYTFDREKQFLFRKLYFRINKWERFKKFNRKETKVRFIRKIVKRKRKLFKKVEVEKIKNNRLETVIKNKLVKKWKETRLLKQKPSRYKKLVKPNYFSQYDQWRHLNELSLAQKSKPFDLKDTTVNNKSKKAKNYLLNLTISNTNAKSSLGKFYKPHFLKKPLKGISIKRLKEKWFKSYALKHGYNKLISFKTKKNRLIYYLTKKGKLDFSSIVIRKKNFYPLITFYKRKPWLEETSKLKSYKKLLKKRNLLFLKKREKVIRKKLSYFGFKHSYIASFLNFKVNNKKYLDAKKVLVYFYIVYILSLLKIKMVSFEETLMVSVKKLKKFSKQDYDIINKPKKKKNVVISKKEKNILIKKKASFYIRRNQNYEVPLNFTKKSLDFYYNKKKFSISFKNCSFDNLISFLLAYLKGILVSYDLKINIINHFKNFSAKYFLQVFYKSFWGAKDKKKREKNLQKFNKDVLTINSFVKLAVNQTKFGKFLLPLKLLISKIYNKKAELNIVNLKSPHLNTDIFTEAVAIKLKKRIGLLKVMRRSLQLVKIPSGFKKAALAFNVNELKTLSSFTNLKLNNLNKNLTVKKIIGLNYSDKFQMMLKTLYTRTLTISPLMVNIRHRLSLQNLRDKRNNGKFNKLSSVLNQIKYKWVTGVRLEAAGRLTRRYTASRSVFKFRQKGSLQNTDYSNKLDFLKTSMPNVMLRNLVKSNSQHSFLDSKKRIGAFGLKTIMSSY